MFTIRSLGDLSYAIHVARLVMDPQLSAIDRRMICAPSTADLRSDVMEADRGSGYDPWYLCLVAS
jgi:hypothetical protein